MKGTNRTFSGEWFVVGGLLLAGGWSVSVFVLFLSVLNHVAYWVSFLMNLDKCPMV